jgi:hypothetical protein
MNTFLSVTGLLGEVPVQAVKVAIIAMNKIDLNVDMGLVFNDREVYFVASKVIKILRG